MIKLIVAMMEIIQQRYMFLKAFKDMGKCTTLNVYKAKKSLLCSMSCLCSNMYVDNGM